jgi:hypothetical protein
VAFFMAVAQRLTEGEQARTGVGLKMTIFIAISV